MKALHQPQIILVHLSRPPLLPVRSLSCYSSSSSLFFSPSSSTWPSERPTNHHTLHAPNAILTAYEDDSTYNLFALTQRLDSLSSVNSLPTTPICTLRN
ncbi:unnamed protein product [Schistocephalus solidus]|uniref:Uncharacterized protein n=1 Tax=Schistocephalus solidus TaxID=70667 RepID=A0A183TN72_SCHSO|nr:unnamed protein product [Schistocephalus solidus]